MGTSEDSKDIIGESLLRIKKAFAEALKDISSQKIVEQKEEGTFESEHLPLGVKHVEDALMIYAVPFQKKVLQIIMDNFPAKEEKYNQEIRRQEADDALLNATTEWPTEKVEKLVSVLGKLNL